MTANEKQCRVLHVIGQLDYGGAELQVSQIARLQVRRGWVVALLVMGYGDVELVDELRSSGVEVNFFQPKWYSPATIMRLRQRLGGQQWDIIHAHLFPALYWCALATLFSGDRIRWIYTEHSTDNRRRRYSVLAAVERIVYHRYDEIVAVSNAVKNALQSWVRKLKVSVVENGVEVSRFVPGTPRLREAFGLSDDDVVILCIGRFREEKNQSILIEALQNLPPVYQLVLVGEGPEKAALQDLCHRNAMTGRVHFFGLLRDVVPIMQASDIYVLPSRFEGFGLSALEAYLTGLPVVYSDVPGLRDLLSGAGFPVDPLDAESVSDGIRRAADSLPEASPRAEIDYLLRQKYSIDRVEAQYREVYCG